MAVSPLPCGARRSGTRSSRPRSWPWGGGALPPPDPAEPGPFSLADAERVRASLQAAGFATIRTEEVAVRFRVGDVEEYVDVTADTAGPMGVALQRLSDADRRSVTTEPDAAIGRFAVEGGYELPGVAICAAAW